MKLRSSLYSRLLLWLLFNLLLMGGLFFAVAGRAGLGWSVLLSQPVRERLLNVGERIGKDLSLTPEAGWDQVLSSYGVEYGVSFSVERAGPLGFFAGRFGGFGKGPDTVFTLQGPPPGLRFTLGTGTNTLSGSAAAVAPPGSPGDQPPGPPLPGVQERGQIFRYGEGAGPVLLGNSRPPEPPFADRRLRGNLIAINHPHSFDDYELRIPATVERDGAPVRPLMLLVRAASLSSLLQFLGVTEWLLFALLVIVLSALLWLPFIWGIAHTVVRVTRATADIADGRFGTRVQTRRRDELGRLADSVNRMAERLQNYVSGQKQFLADVAHEVTSPLARMQLGLGILESRLGEGGQRTLRDVQEEAQQMSRLLDELLLFSRAGLQTGSAAPEVLELRPLLREVLRREDPGHAVRLDVEDELHALAQGALLERAVANLVRNALRYGGATPVELRAARDGEAARILVSDRGPGVPAAALARLGEPFFRPEVARDRDSGGSGLGLAIVRRCVESCGGSLEFRNREGGGFEAEIRLKAA
ncbi:MAG TPA: HAMP domain-containing sensor histidine kinase [Nevskia sp.]|nr:HAMP domain-containing sensor histidine kinase [Nevskia sp.]